MFSCLDRKKVCAISLRHLILGFVLLFLFPLSGYGSVLVSLEVEDHAGMSRVSEPVTSGVPLPASAKVFSVDELRLTKAGTVIPAQFTVLSRWNGLVDEPSKPIKWVLLDFQADVSTNGTSIYNLENQSGNVLPTKPLSLQEDGDKIVVSTGKARFQISKHHFNLFDYVFVDKNGDGTITDPIISSPGEGGLVLTDTDGKIFRSTLETPEEIVIEESGPMRAVVKIRGVFKSQDGSYFAPSICQPAEYPTFCQPYEHSFFYYNCRIHFYSGSDEVRVFFTIENNGANGQTNPEPNFAPWQVVYFDSLKLVMSPELSSNVQVDFDPGSTELSGAEVFSIFQSWKEGVHSLADGPFYEIKKNGGNLTSGSTYPGWVSIGDDQVKVEFAMRHFWQNFPKGLTISSSEISFDVWPVGSEYPLGSSTGYYLFDAGRHKTAEVMFKFSADVSASDSAEILYKSIENPLIALAPANWYADSKALGMIAPAGLIHPNPLINEAIDRYDRLQLANVFEDKSENGLTMLNLKTASPPFWEYPKQDRFYGWMHFGDLLWDVGIPCNLHYDWTYVMFLHFLRTGERRFYDAGVEMVKHRYDVDQYHGERTDISNNHKWTNHMQFYETSGHADPALCWHPSKVSPPTHTWNGGLTLYYLLRGDKKAWETAEENARGAMNYYGPGGIRDATNLRCPNDEIRYEGWSILLLLNAYRVSGSLSYLETAKNTAINRLIYREQQSGSGGHWGCDESSGICASMREDVGCVSAGCNSCGNTEWNTMYSYVIDPLIQIHYETGDEEIRQLLIRMADFSKNQFLFGGLTRPDGKYLPLGTSYLWVEESYDPEGTDGEVIKDIFFSDLFAYAFSLTGESVYMDWAERCFRDTIFYYGAAPGYIDPAYRSRISYIDEKFPNTRTKVHGWLGRAGQVFLHTQYTGDGSWYGVSIGDPFLYIFDLLISP